MHAFQLCQYCRISNFIDVCFYKEYKMYQKHNLALNRNRDTFIIKQNFLYIKINTYTKRI